MESGRDEYADYRSLTFRVARCSPSALCSRKSLIIGATASYLPRFIAAFVPGQPAQTRVTRKAEYYARPWLRQGVFIRLDLSIHRLCQDRHLRLTSMPLTPESIHYVHYAH